MALLFGVFFRHPVCPLSSFFLALFLEASDISQWALLRKRRDRNKVNDFVSFTDGPLGSCFMKW